ncbi:hypothetical protein [Streptomyces vilmorinianum]|uniref:hypothetical protein n=1 Tax=Streptomyces vilmorinianum TaxID=3051092 RepID=UPI0015867C5E|nr:hypothetical protein [Streptomyces vilmorinianum]
MIAASYPPIARLSRPALHTEQIRWNADQSRRRGDALDWPFTVVEPRPWEAPRAG